MKSILTIAAILLFAIVGAAQKPCKLTPETTPPLAGFKLGMTSIEAGLDPKHPAWQGKPEFGWTRADLTPEHLNKISAGRGAGIKEVALGFFDDHLTAIRVVYVDSKSWPSFKDFQKYITAVFKLPNAWPPLDPFSDDIEESLMACDNLDVFIRYFAGSRATVSFEDVRSDKEYERRKASRP